MATKMYTAGLLLLISGIAAGSALPPLGYERKLLHELLDKRQDGSCLAGETPLVTAPKPNPWAPITPEDNLAVWNLLHDEATGLNLTDPGDATVSDNYVFWIDTVPSNKSDILPYIDGNGEAPPKYARAIIFEGAKGEPGSQEYMIGPLPVSNETVVAPLDYIYNGGSGGFVPFNARYHDAAKSAAVEPLVVEIMTNISDITQALFQGAAYYGREDERTNLTQSVPTPLSLDGTQAMRVVLWRFPGTASYLTPLDFYTIFDTPGTDPSHYTLRGFVTNSKLFKTIDELRSAFEAGELAQEFDQTTDSDWAMVDYKPELGTRELEERFAPSSLELGGKRYKIDMDERYVEYMGWSFYISYSRTLGIMFYDIKFKGERILYELSLQEALAQYSGYTPKAAGTTYHDTYYSLGVDMVILQIQIDLRPPTPKEAALHHRFVIYTLVEGFDCSFGATFLNISYHEGNTTTSNPHALCIFEQDSGFPLSRHFYGGGNSSYAFSRLGVTKGAALVVRAIATIGNYDYMFDYKFHQDGSLEVVARASGYLQSSFYYPDQGRYGPRIQQATQGSLHDHILNYKADFDILGAANSFQVSDLVLRNSSQPWFPELGEFEQMELDIKNLETESAFNFAPNNAAMYCVVNEDEKNAWGETRGYRILPGRSNVHLTPMNSPFSAKNAEFAKTNLAVTRQHDNEPYSNSVMNVNLPLKPQQDFSKFFDDESLEQEDLVVWFNLGMHHFTRSEDIPVTLFTEAYSSIVFAPQNFFDRAQDGDLLNRRWFVVDSESGELEVETYNVELPTCAVELEEPAEGIMVQGEL